LWCDLGIWGDAERWHSYSPLQISLAKVKKNDTAASDTSRSRGARRETVGCL